jgi:aspartate/methionine/tyrosine aminotransferase
MEGPKPKNHGGMTAPDRTKSSAYMQWAKTRSQARYVLATSGLTNVPISQFPFHDGNLEVTGPGGYGYEPLQRHIARHAGVPVECVIAATGTSMANHLAMAAVLEPGDEVLIERPTYPLNLDIANYLGARVKRFERKFEDDFVIDPDRIRSGITSKTRLIVMTNMHNPSGALVPGETVRAIGEMALRANARVLVDEVYLEMLFDNGAPFSFGIGQEIASRIDNPFIATNSLTKVYGLSGLRCGWVLGSSELIQRMWYLNDLFGVNAAHPAELMAVMAFEHLAELRAHARELLAANRVLLDQFLDSRANLECFRPSAGTVVFPRLDRGDPDTFLKLLREKYDTTVVPGRFFEMPQHFRIGIGGETPDVQVGLERLSAALDEFAAS